LTSTITINCPCGFQTLIPFELNFNGNETAVSVICKNCEQGYNIRINTAKEVINEDKQEDNH
jgi:transcription elongation factor Elf1